MNTEIKHRLIIVTMSVIGYLICNMTFLMGHRRKKYFALHIAVGMGITGLVTYGTACLQAMIVNKFVGPTVKNISYLCLAAIIAVVQMSWYEDILQELLMSVVAGIALNMMITSIPFHATGDFFNQYRWIYWGRYIIIPIAVYLFYARKNERLREKNYNKSFMAIRIEFFRWLAGN